MAGRSGLFKLEEDVLWNGPTWQLLGQVCQGARLTVREAQAVNLYCRGFPVGLISRTLGTDRRGRINGWRDLHRAVGKVAIFYPELADSRRKRVWEMLKCLRNVGLGGEPPRVVYDASGRVVGQRSRPFGSVPEDLLGDELGLLEELALRIKERLQKTA